MVDEEILGSLKLTGNRQPLLCVTNITVVKS